jgi:hypothetical protein
MSITGGSILRSTKLERVALGDSDGLHFWQHSVVFLLACAVLVTRRPDAIFHAQFYAEDGHVWFADAYNFGWWSALFRAQDGYYQTFPRLAAAFALLAPLWLAPLILNLVALAAEALPVNLLLSARSSAWGSLRFRALLAVAYLALPNSREMTIIVTSSQWLLMLSAFLVLTATPADSAAGSVFDFLILVLCGLTGPFCFFLLPIAAFLAWRRGGRWGWMMTSVLLVTTLVQAWALLVIDRSGRSHAVLGAGAALFTRILAGQIYFATLLGGNSLAANSSPVVFSILLCAAIAGTALLAVCFARAGLEMRLFLVLTGMLLIASLISPAAYPPPGMSRWEMLAKVAGIRYWFFPTLVCTWSLLWAARSRIEALKAASVVLLFAMCFGVVRDWRQPALNDRHFAEYVKAFEAAPPGTVVVLPENPPGWNIRLAKHSSN